MPERLGTLLARHRKAAGLGMRELSRRSGTTVSTISAVESLERTPPTEAVGKWADALGLEGRELERFLLAGLREKAHAQTDAKPYLEQLEAALDSAIALLTDVTRLLAKSGNKVPQDVLKKLEALNATL